MTSIHNMIEFTSSTSSFLTALFIEQKILVHSRKNLQIEEDSRSVWFIAFFWRIFQQLRLMDTFLEARGMVMMRSLRHAFELSRHF